MSKFGNAVKATCIVLGFCCAGLAAAALCYFVKVAGWGVLAPLLGLLPFVAFGFLVYLVYARLERG